MLSNQSNFGVPAGTQTRELEAEFQRGISLREAGQLEESQRVLEAVLTGRTLALGAEHHDTQAAKSQLGRTLREMGDAERLRARALHEECLAFRRQVLGNDHEWTKNSMRILAETLDGMSLGDEARRLREEAGPDRVAALFAETKGKTLAELGFHLSDLPKVAIRDTLGDLYSRRDQKKDQGMLSS